MIHVVKWDVIQEKNIIVIDALVKVENATGARLVKFINAKHIPNIYQTFTQHMSNILYRNLLY